MRLARRPSVAGMAEHSLTRLAGYAVAAVLVVVAALKLFAPHPGAHQAGEAPIRVDGSAGGLGDSGRGRAYVHVAGAVRRPGLYRLRRSARVAAALRRAGGPARRADLAAVNLAAVVEDGQQIVVPAKGAAGAADGTGGGGGRASRVSLGSATVEQLDGLDGIGPTLAKRIVDYRQSHGGFRSVDDLRGVQGIGDKRLAALKKALGP
jgi:competence protein ComEA